MTEYQKKQISRQLDEINTATFLASLSTENGSTGLPSLFTCTNTDMQPLGSTSKRLKHSMSCFSFATEAMEAATQTLVFRFLAMSNSMPLTMYALMIIVSWLHHRKTMAETYP